ncbi:GDSL esterase/lipase At1g29670-like isoform X2 [Glycine soja]|uniref:GDSL esterase/lipase At1g29670-like isoform X2 n=1 Tax=Glycine soja TaxID=3848 RepID=UPI00103B8B49|nr:GDSL esterase/lipase At1g29670-like isoform X2 [Glycine soja]
MACETKTWLVMVLLFLAANYLQDCVHGVSQVPCLFIFGDSLSDSGNNNELPTSAKSNYRPYGIDFPLGPTGRFTNGRTEIDIITQLLGFEKFIPPFANTSGSDILKGVNYASGGAGIRVETSSHLGATISFGLQLANHRVIVSQIASRLGSSDLALQYLEKCLYYVNIGSNDYMNNYFLPQLYPASRIYSLEQYAQALIEELSLNLLALHDLGARKYVLARLGRIGCTPSVMHSHGTNGSCVEEQNAATSDYNNKLKALVDQFNDSACVSGFLVSDAACCPSGCNPDQKPCNNRSHYLFWDEVHPTEAWNLVNAISVYNSTIGPAFNYPMDIKQLVESEIKRELEFTNESPSQPSATE